MKPGDKLLDGNTLRSGKCAGRQDKVFYTSPTIRHDGLKFHAEPMRFGTQMAGSIVLQCWQQPESYSTQSETMRFTKDWSGHLQRSCPHTSLGTVEWKSNRNVCVVPYGILVRVWAWGCDREEKNYSSPVGIGCR